MVGWYGMVLAYELRLIQLILMIIRLKGVYIVLWIYMDNSKYVSLAEIRFRIPW